MDLPELQSLKKRLPQEASELKKSLRATQMELLKTLDQRALVEGVLFNILIGNTDWALFGLNNHSTGVRNFKFVKKGGQIVPLAYDFDLAAFAEGRSVSKEDYQVRFQEFRRYFQEHLGEQGSLEEGLSKFKSRVETLLRSGEVLSDPIRAALKNFLDVFTLSKNRVLESVEGPSPIIDIPAPANF